MVDVILALVAACAISVTVATTVFRVAAVPIALDAIITLFGLVALVLVLIRVLDLPDGAAGREAGLWVALAAAAGVAASGALSMRDERLSPPGSYTDATGRPVPEAAGGRAAAGSAARQRHVTLEPGAERTEEFVAEGRLLTDVGGTLPVSVLSTPGMIGVMERCAAVLAFEQLGDGPRHRGLRGLRQARGSRRRGSRLHRDGAPARDRRRAQAPLRRGGEGGRPHPRRGHPRAARHPAGGLRGLSVIDRDQVLHVARLARLRLSDEEVDAMVEELPKILGHIEKMEELDLEGVEPTSHVVELENVLRADEPRPSLPVEKALEPAPDPQQGGFGVPSPGRS